jgi:hypothetical protein
VALFTVAEVWSQARCPSMDRQIKKICYLYTLFSHKEQNQVICRKLDGTAVHRVKKISQTQKDKHHMLSLTCGIQGRKGKREITREKKKKEVMCCLGLVQNNSFGVGCSGLFL